MAMTRDRAEVLALEALGWLAAEERLDAFMGATGADRDGIAAAANDPAFLGAVLDFVMSDEAVARPFCEDHRLSPENLWAARAALPGGAQTHWT